MMKPHLLFSEKTHPWPIKLPSLQSENVRQIVLQNILHFYCYCIFLVPTYEMEIGLSISAITEDLRIPTKRSQQESLASVSCFNQPATNTHNAPMKRELWRKGRGHAWMDLEGQWAPSWGCDSRRQVQRTPRIQRGQSNGPGLHY